MEDTKHTYTIQWVGPLTYDEYKEYVKGTDTIASGYFNFYYFEARKDARCRWRRYVGIHKQNDGIEKRLNPKHEHFSEFLDCKDLRIWIVSFADTKNQKADSKKWLKNCLSKHIIICLRRIKWKKVLCRRVLFVSSIFGLTKTKS